MSGLAFKSNNVCLRKKNVIKNLEFEGIEKKASKLHICTLFIVSEVYKWYAQVVSMLQLGLSMKSL